MSIHHAQIAANLRGMIPTLPANVPNADLIDIWQGAGGFTDTEVCAFVVELIDEGFDWDDIMEIMVPVYPIANAA